MIRWRKTSEEPPQDKEHCLVLRPESGSDSYDYVPSQIFPATYHADDGDGWWYEDDVGFGEYWLPLSDIEPYPSNFKARES